MIGDDVRRSPDYARGYESAFCQEPAEQGATAEYRAGYDAAQSFVEALQKAGLRANPKVPGNYSLSMTLGPMSQISFDLTGGER